jgi:dihydrofolate synthase/folylpolyglutamate synthase
LPDPHVLPAGLAGWLSYLEQLHPKSIALGLDRVSLIKDRLSLVPSFPVITVAGTNGKGSTCAMLEQIYLEAGYRVACYTSPHLLRYNERVRVDGLEASDDALCAAFAQIETVRQGTPLTYFEYGTLAAMWHFMHTDVDVAILEVGLGGRLDAVNIFEPACAIVTSVDLDHMDYLGQTRERIGREKAGIFRQGVPALCGDPSPPDALLEHARDIGADIRLIGRSFGFERHASRWSFSHADTRIRHLPLPALSGEFQMFNAACVVEAVTTLQPILPVPREALAAGLQHVRLAGRFQTVALRPQVILDVAHNPHAAQGLAENLRKNSVPGKTIAVCAMLSDKDINGVMHALVGVVDVWHVASIQQVRGAEASVLDQALHEAAEVVTVSCYENVISAFRQACLGVGENDRIVVFGSFYTVADVMRELPDTLGDAWQPIS